MYIGRFLPSARYSASFGRWFLSFCFADVQTDDHPLGVRQVAYYLTNRDRKASDKRGNGQNLVVSRQGRVLEQIDHFNVIVFLEVSSTNVFQIRDGRQ